MSSSSSRASLLRRLAAGCVVVLAAVMLAGVAFYLANTQADAREGILADFDARGSLAAKLSGDTLGASDAKSRAWAEQTLTAPVAELPPLLDVQRSGITGLMVLSADGSVAAASPRSLAKVAATLHNDVGYRMAMATGRLAYGDVAPGPTAAANVYAYQPYEAVDGRRVLVLPVAFQELVAVVHSALDVTGGNTYLIDGSGAVLASSGKINIADAVRDRVLAEGKRHAGRGTVEDHYYVANSVASTAWRVVLVAPRNTLMAPVSGPAKVAWMIYAGFAVVVVLMLLIGAAAVVSSARIAHARLHDTLTGLPNRALFLGETERTIAQRRPAAVLFLDLDGFKPVNDTLGHAAGDALLAEVGRRLVAATRPEDYVSRFGGDEFLVLCRELVLPTDAHTVAERIQRYLNEPFEIDGRPVHVGVSIGIAVLDDYADTPENLIHHADLALYEAKHNGRGRIEQFTPAMADAAAS